MRFVLIALLFLGMKCNGQDLDTLIYIDRVKHEAAMAAKDNTIDSLQSLLIRCREAQEVNDVVVIADTFRFEVKDTRVKATIVKQGHNVWFDFEDGLKRINADYLNYRRSCMLMDSTYTVGSLFVREHGSFTAVERKN